MKDAAEQLYFIEKQLEKWGLEYKHSLFKTYMTLGGQFNIVHESEIWKAGEWKSFKEWLQSIGFKHTRAYEMMKIHKTYKDVRGIDDIDVRRLLPLVPFYLEASAEDKAEMLFKARELLTRDYDDYISELQDKPTINECDHKEGKYVFHCSRCKHKHEVRKEDIK